LAYWQFEQQRYCSRRCAGLARGLAQRVSDDEFKAPYRQVKLADGRKMQEHRWIMEQYLGRPLLPNRRELVHHRDENKLNNSIENLEVVTTTEHGERHTWRPLTTICAICGVEFTPHKTKRGRTKTCGQKCGAQLTWRTRRAKASGLFAEED